jgi:hypothetical protein
MPADSPYFERTCEMIERGTLLNRLQARGTMRFALKAAGFDARSVNRPQMLATILQALPDELRRRGVDDCQSLCNRIAEQLASLDASH